MTEPEISTHWRPNPFPRAIAIGLPFADEALLCAEVTNDDGSVKGYRPLGGGIELGEGVAEALRREMREEVGAVVEIGPRVAVLENIFHHEGALGHEIVFVYHVTILEPGLIKPNRFLRNENGRVTAIDWVPVARFRDGSETLFPDGLVSHL